MRHLLARAVWRFALLAMILVAVAGAGRTLAADMKIIVPASPGGGWDQLGRAVQQSLQANKLAGKVQVTNVPGAGGTVGLATLGNTSKGDPNALLVSGRGMVGAIYINQSPVTLTSITPVARLTGEHEVLVVPAASKLKTMADLVAMYKANPGSVSWAGGLAGGVDMLTAAMIIQAIGGDPSKLNYVAFGGGGEVLAQVLGGHVTVGMGGYNEFAAQIKSGKLRALGISADKRLAGIDVPTLKEQGVDVEFINWRGVMGAPGLNDAQRQELVNRVSQMAKSDHWKSLLQKNGWIDMFMAGDEFKAYLDTEQKATLDLVTKLGLVKK